MAMVQLAGRFAQLMQPLPTSKQQPVMAREMRGFLGLSPNSARAKVTREGRYQTNHGNGSRFLRRTRITHEYPGSPDSTARECGTTPGPCRTKLQTLHHESRRPVATTPRQRHPSIDGSAQANETQSEVRSRIAKASAVADRVGW